MSTDAPLVASGWQTVGPFFHFALPWEDGGKLAREGARGERVRLVGTIVDGGGKPIDDAMIEVWQANADGKYDHPDDRQMKPLDPAFTGFGRVTANKMGEFVVETVRPGRVPGPGNTEQAPHINLAVFARGVSKRLVTRVYFEGDAANTTDPVLELVPPERRGSLMARPGNAPGEWRYSVRLQGDDETVFFDI